MKKIFVLFAIVLGATTVNAQRTQWITRNANISFIASKDEGVTAVNNQVFSKITNKGEISFNLLMKGFKFELAEMQDHFNSEYVHSDKYPSASFKGQITNFNAASLAKDGTYKVQVKGALTMHGVTRPVNSNGTIEVKKGKVKADSKFVININDFKIDEGIGGSMIGNKMTITVSAQYQ